MIRFAGPLLDGFKLAFLDKPFLDRDLQNIEYVREEIQWMWPGLARFYEKGFGVCATREDEVVCWCTAEYVSSTTCGIGIETVESYRNMGIATAVAAEFMRYCRLHNITPYWECEVANIPSMRVAGKLGFRKLKDSTVFDCDFRRPTPLRSLNPCS